MIISDFALGIKGAANLRDIKDLLDRNILKKDRAGGRSTGYRLGVD